MRKLATFIAAAFLSSTAAAADLTPLPRSAVPQYPEIRGWFFGASLAGLGGTASAASPFQAGATVGIRAGFDVGYHGTWRDTFWFVEQTVAVQGVNASGNLSLGTALALQQRYALGVPQSYLDRIAEWFRLRDGMPSLPAISTGGPPRPYIFASTYQDNVSATLGPASRNVWLFSYGAGIGALQRMQNGWVLDTSIEWKHDSGGIVIGGFATQPFQNAYLATIRVKM